MKLPFCPAGAAGNYARSIHHERCMTSAKIADHERWERERHESMSGESGAHLTIRNIGGRPKVRCNNCRDWATWIIEGLGMRGDPARGVWIVCEDCREWARHSHRQANATTINEDEIGDLDCFTCGKPIRDGDPYVAPILSG